MKGRPGRLSARALPLGVSGWEALSEDMWSCGKVTRLLETALSTGTPSGEPSQENPPKPSRLRPRAVLRDARMGPSFWFPGPLAALGLVPG